MKMISPPSSGIQRASTVRTPYTHSGVSTSGGASSVSGSRYADGGSSSR